MAEHGPATVDLTVGSATRPVPVSPHPTPDTGRHLPARLIIVGWFLLLFAVLVLVNVVARQALLRSVDEQIGTALSQESTEFAQVAQAGVNRSTDLPYTGVRELLESHLQRQYPDDDEVMIAVLPDGQVLRQQREEPVALSTEPDRVRAIVDSVGATGTVTTPQGELRWRKVNVLPSEGGAPGVFVTAITPRSDLETVSGTVRTLVGVSLVGLLLAGLGAYLVAGQILAPVRLVRQAVAEIGERDLTRRIPVQGRDDISALAEQFNAMLDRLDTAFSTQRQFVDDASHELRTPITIVRGHVELMGDDPTERAETVRLVTDELDRMSRIVEDLLLLAKAQQPDFVRFSEVSVAELTSDVDAKVRAIGDRRWILEAIGEGTAMLDAQRVTQAMVQLAQNAVSHTRTGDVIRVGSALHPGHDGVELASFWVTDTGPGVRPQDAQAIFDRFSRGSTGGARPNHTGAGLGLAIVRAIAEAHHGSVRLVSEPGAGATFGIELPADPRSAPHPAERTP